MLVIWIVWSIRRYWVEFVNRSRSCRRLNRAARHRGLIDFEFVLALVYRRDVTVMGFRIVFIASLLAFQTTQVAFSSLILLTSRTGTPGVYEVDVATGARSIFSATGTGTGTGFNDPRGIATDSGFQFAYVADFANKSVVKIDLSNGNRTTLSSSSVGAGTNFDDPVGIGIESSGNIIVADNGENAIFRVDLSTGNRTIISKPGSVGTGTGGDSEFSSINGFAIDSSGNILVADETKGAIIKVDPTTGDRSILSNDTSGVGTGTNLARPQSVTIDSSGNVFVSDETNLVFRIDPANGNRIVIASNSIGSGDAFASGFNKGLKGITFDTVGKLLVTSNANDSVYQLVATGDPDVFNRLIVSGGSTGSGTAFGNLTSGSTQFGSPSTPIPEPSSLALLGMGLGAFLVRSRRRHTAKNTVG